MGDRSEMEKLVDFKALRKAYSGKRIFVTGHTGFKGTWLLVLLESLGAQVKGYALSPESNEDMYGLIGGDRLCDSVIGDIRNRERLTHELVSFHPDFVFHLAAQALVLESYAAPVETYETNLMGTVNVLDAVRRLEKPCKVISVTTDKVYENLERIEPYKENERLGGYDPYSNSKACCELAVSSYRNSFFNPADFPNHHKSIATARSGNVIGGGDRNENRIIPDLVRSMENDEPLVVRNPNAVRPWQHVLDPLNGYLVLGAKMNEDPVEFADSYNFGPYQEDTLTVVQLIQTAIKVWGKGTYEALEKTNQPHEATLLRLSIEKAQKHLKWEPRYNAALAVEMTIDWYKNYRERDPFEVTKRQIEHFYAL